MLLLLLLLAAVSSPSAALETANATARRRLQRDLAPGNIAACYSPMHSAAYPIGQQALRLDALRESMDADFALMAQHVTHVRTFYSQYFGINVAEIAARHGLKLYLGIFMTTEAWGSTEIDAAVDAVRRFPDTVEAILVGNENLHKGVSAAAILSVVAQIKSRLGGAARVQFGTVQRITEYMAPAMDGETRALEANLDILGVNIYPFFDRNYDAAGPTALLETLWDGMARKFAAHKMRLTETGFPTAGGASPEAPNVVAGLDASVAYYEAVRRWTPAVATPKFWFSMFDRRPDDNSMGIEVEKHFGFFTHERVPKRLGFPATRGRDAPTPDIPAPVPVPAPVPSPELTPAPAPVPSSSPDATSAPSATSSAPQPSPVPSPTAPVPAPVATPCATSPRQQQHEERASDGDASSAPPTSSPPSVSPTPSPSTELPTPQPSVELPTPAPTWNQNVVAQPPSERPTPTPTPSQPTPVPSTEAPPTTSPEPTQLSKSSSEPPTATPTAAATATPAVTSTPTPSGSSLRVTSTPSGSTRVGPSQREQRSAVDSHEETTPTPTSTADSTSASSPSSGNSRPARTTTSAASPASMAWATLLAVTSALLLAAL
ncbi:hypothetical protein P43SY_008353 [Pythium insidiosum]|uniref:glucan endo-1,3-beta-D-glucosidase n=1 Tax=Pythium insidiosum TaxID=114742 RepID=A0AAD5LME1_PYTIN|nr:hypothetical protein P43SY_008353 [Pythium insidiosum]